MCGLILWVVSYFGAYPAIAATGLANAPPPGPTIPLPLRGNLERWEYTDWDSKWYFVNRGLPLWIPTFVLLVLPSLWLLTRLKRDEAAISHEP